MNASPGYVLITGASTGIGRACATRLAEAGFAVFAGVRSEKAAAEIARPGITPIRLDITDAAQIAGAARTVSLAAGEAGLAALVNNAGISVHGPVEHVPLSDWRRQFETNFFGQIAITQVMLPLLRQRVAAGGRGSARIVMMSSIAGLIAQPIIAPYNASKYALEAASDALRMELAPQGIYVAIVEPGAIDTPIWAKAEANPGTFPADHPARVLYGGAIDGVVNSAMKSAAAAIPAEEAAKVVQRCITGRRPRARYLVGRDARIGAMAKWVLPTRVLDWGMARALGI